MGFLVSCYIIWLQSRCPFCFFTRNCPWNCWEWKYPCSRDQPIPPFNGLSEEILETSKGNCSKSPKVTVSESAEKSICSIPNRYSINCACEWDILYYLLLCTGISIFVIHSNIKSHRYRGGFSVYAVWVWLYYCLLPLRYPIYQPLYVTTKILKG